MPDRQQAAEWYRTVLGLTILPAYEQWASDPRGPLMISSDGGQTKLALFQGSPPTSRPRGQGPEGHLERAGFDRVAFRVGAASFKRFVDGLSARNLVDDRGRPGTADAVADHTVTLSIYFCDPFGHRLELTTYEYQQAKELLGRD